MKYSTFNELTEYKGQGKAIESTKMFKEGKSMKTRRLLALVLCFVMLFSDATGTLASTFSDEPIVITDSSELEELPNVEVIDNKEPETDVTSTEKATEVVISTETEKPAEEPENATESADTIEVVEPTEVVEDTEEIVIEVVEDIKAASNTSLTSIVGLHPTFVIP